ncbi:uncharacterized protein DUF58 [Herbinix hemicellulosilytica]|uniref:DUF58 domain-containing protein n=1 Tax=Herbinix hemicellulosilytica TaxID=1564487 RepID=A0A0H5SYR6_HERHM|nr:DUF58 domain-containing protein [Herbinix hemicellulosilytica]RBP58057.1 uncharacterized protein DUF58 [Herbinix hemicellulosilytica]CRZ35518.1 hypothetical protein HHT355_2329 [Herbinix hemicellulosilytica]
MVQNQLKYIAIIILTGLLAVLYNDYYMGILFLAVVICPFILLAILFYVYVSLSVELVSSAHVASKGENIPVSVQIHNPTLFPVTVICITISYVNSFSDRFKQHKQVFYVSVDSRSTTHATCNLKSDYAGNIVVSLSKVKIYDYLKIFSLRKKNLNEIKVAVLPNLYEMTDDIINARCGMQIESDTYSNTKSGDDPSEVFAIREYREGDRPQRIHWKLSLKQNQLMIKDFSEPLNCSVVIIADMAISGRNDGPDIIDSLLDCTLSLSYSFMLKGKIHYLAWYDKTQETIIRVRIVNENDLYEAIDGLLSSGPYIKDVDVAADYFAQYANELYTDVFYITNRVNDEKLDSLILIKSTCRLIIYVNKDEESAQYSSIAQEDFTADNIKEKLLETGMGLFFVSSSDIKSGLKNLKINSE